MLSHEGGVEDYREQVPMDHMHMLRAACAKLGAQGHGYLRNPFRYIHTLGPNRASNY